MELVLGGAESRWFAAGEPSSLGHGRFDAVAAVEARWLFGLRTGRPGWEDPAAQFFKCGYAVRSRAEVRASSAGEVSRPTDWTRRTPARWRAAGLAEVWSWLARRPAMVVVVAGAEGGVGTSTVAALVGEAVAAGSVGNTVLVDQCGAMSGSLARRLVGERQTIDAMRLTTGQPAGDLRAVPRTAAGAHLVDDSAGYVGIDRLVPVLLRPGGALVLDAGRVGLVLAAQLGLRPVVIVVGRADVLGAEAVCAALSFLRGRLIRVEPIVVLSSCATKARRARGARRLVIAAGARQVVDLPFDERLVDGQLIWLDRLGRSTVAAVVTVLAAIREVVGDAAG